MKAKDKKEGAEEDKGKEEEELGPERGGQG